MNFDKNFEQSCGHFSTADLCHSTLTLTKLTDTYSRNWLTMFNSKLAYQEHLWNVHLFILDGSAVVLQHSGCKVQKTNGIQVRQENPMFQTIPWHDRVGRFLAPYPSWQDRVKFHDCTNRWGHIGWLRNVILRGLSSGLKRQIGFIVNKTMFHLQKDKSSSYEMHGLDLLASHLPCGRFA